MDIDGYGWAFTDMDVSTCMLCLGDKGVGYISLYVVGSGGLWVCHECEVKLVEFVRKLRSESGKTRLEKMKND